jgi:hypothetical protein
LTMKDMGAPQTKNGFESLIVELGGFVSAV